MPKKKGGGSRKAAETPEEKAMRLEMERIKAIEDEIHRAGAGSAPVHEGDAAQCQSASALALLKTTPWLCQGDFLKGECGACVARAIACLWQYRR